jgi:CHASE3 domain sensor protein
MAKVVETEEPVVRERQTVVHEDRPGSNVGAILVALAILIILIALLAWRPWSGGGVFDLLS